MPDVPVVSGSFRSRQIRSGMPFCRTADSMPPSRSSSITVEPGRNRRNSITTASRISGWSSMT